MAHGTTAELQADLIAMGEREGGRMWFGKPDRWFAEGPRWRCRNDHVSASYLKSERVGDDLCFECGEPVRLTHPEDSDGPLKLSTNGR